MEATLRFYENMLSKRDYAWIEALEKKLYKTEKLLALDFLLGEPGTLNELINKLCLTHNCCLSKEGIYRVLGEILTASPDNIKKDITKRVSEIRYGEKLSPKRIDQLRNVKAIFNQANLAKIAGEIEMLVTTNRTSNFNKNMAVATKDLIQIHYF